MLYPIELQVRLLDPEDLNQATRIQDAEDTCIRRLFHPQSSNRADFCQKQCDRNGKPVPKSPIQLSIRGFIAEYQAVAKQHSSVFGSGLVPAEILLRGCGGEFNTSSCVTGIIA